MLDTAGDWVELQGDGGTRGIAFMHGTGGTNTQWWIKYFVRGYGAYVDGHDQAFDGHDAFAALEAQNVHGTDAVGTLLFTTDNTYRWHTVASDDGSFAAFAWLKTTYAPYTIFGIDKVTPFYAADVEPWVLFAQYSAAGTAGSLGGAWALIALVASAFIRGFVGRTGNNTGTWDNIPMPAPYGGSALIPNTTTILQNALSGKDLVLTAFYTKDSASSNEKYPKGKSSVFLQNPCGRILPNTIAVTAAKDHIPFCAAAASGGLILPWDGASDPLG
jgi:hypothetical protein